MDERAGIPTLKAQARKAGLGIDPFIRNLVAGVQLQPRPPDEVAALVRELHAIGNNANQIAYWANAQKSVTEGELGGRRPWSMRRPVW